MKNKPMNSGEQSKLLTFFLLMLPPVVLLVGLVPVMLLAFGIYMMKKNQNFSSIDTAVKVFKGYTWLLLTGCIISSLYWGNQHFTEGDSWDTQYFVFSLILMGIAFAYLLAVHFLFYTPMNKHREWVEVNGIFSTKPKLEKTLNVKPEVDIIKGEKLKQYSVADELIKWAKLKDDGHISEDEFNHARVKLLKRN